MNGRLFAFAIVSLFIAGSSNAQDIQKGAELYLNKAIATLKTAKSTKENIQHIRKTVPADLEMAERYAPQAPVKSLIMRAQSEVRSIQSPSEALMVEKILTQALEEVKKSK